MRHWTLVIFLLLVIRVAGWQDASIEAATPIVARDYKVYIPMFMLAPSKKCVAISEIEQIGQVGKLDTNCTYVYWPYVYTGTVEVSNMLKWGDPLTLTNNSQYWFGWNEPDLQGITPQMAASLWDKAVVANRGKKSVSPAPSHLHPEWLESFLLLVEHKPDVLAIHCYATVIECKQIIGKIIALADRYDLDVFVTELGYQGTNWLEQAQTLIDWLYAQWRIKRFYWFSLIGNGYWSGQNLIDPISGQLTDKGKFYKELDRSISP